MIMTHSKASHITLYNSAITWPVNNSYSRAPRLHQSHAGVTEQILITSVTNAGINMHCIKDSTTAMSKLSWTIIITLTTLWRVWYAYDRQWSDSSVYSDNNTSPTQGHDKTLTCQFTVISHPSWPLVVTPHLSSFHIIVISYFTWHNGLAKL